MILPSMIPVKNTLQTTKQGKHNEHRTQVK